MSGMHKMLCQKGFVAPSPAEATLPAICLLTSEDRSQGECQWYVYQRHRKSEEELRREQSGDHTRERSHVWNETSC